MGTFRSVRAILTQAPGMQHAAQESLLFATSVGKFKFVCLLVASALRPFCFGFILRILQRRPQARVDFTSVCNRDDFSLNSLQKTPVPPNKHSCIHEYEIYQCCFRFATMQLIFSAS